MDSPLHDSLQPAHFPAVNKVTCKVLPGHTQCWACASWLTSCKWLTVCHLLQVCVTWHSRAVHVINDLQQVGLQRCEHFLQERLPLCSIDVMVHRGKHSCNTCSHACKPNQMWSIFAIVTNSKLLCLRGRCQDKISVQVEGLTASDQVAMASRYSR